MRNVNRNDDASSKEEDSLVTESERTVSERIASERIASERTVSERTASERTASERTASERTASSSEATASEGTTSSSERSTSERTRTASEADTTKSEDEITEAASSFCDVSLDDNEVCKSQSFVYDLSIPVDEEIQDPTCCSARNCCTWLSILIAVLSLAGLVLAAIPSTTHIALLVFLPMVMAAVLVCSILSCCIVCANDNKVVIEPTDLPEPTPKSKQGKTLENVEVKGEDTTATILTEGALELGSSEKPFIFRALPELFEFVHETQKSIDETAAALYKKLFKPAVLCRPITPKRCLSTGAKSLVTDIECGVDIENLRDENGAINLTGTYKLIHNDNFDGLLKALSISALLRKAANAARPTHKYTQKGDSFRVQIEGIIKGDTTFIMNGPPTTSFIRVHEFLDYPTYLEDKRGIQIRKVLQNQPKSSKFTTTEIIVSRELCSGGQKMIMHSLALDADGNEVARSAQTFHRV